MQAVSPRGFSADTEILTRHGWVTFDRLTYLDEVATRSPEGRFLWQYPERITWERHDGDMIWFRSRTANLLVGPETPVLHLFIPRTTGTDRKRHELPPAERTRPAGSLANWHGSLVATSAWKPDGPAREFTFMGTPARTYGTRFLPRRQFRASADDFAAFMGMYLAEGSLNSSGKGEYSIWIHQSYKGRGYSEFQDLLDKICGRPLPWYKVGGWHFANKALFEFLKTCGGYAWTKVIPAQVLDLPREHLEQFWHYYYWLGDGTTLSSGRNRKPLESISTTSKVMAGQFQELLQKLGGWALIQTIDGSKYPSKIGKTKRLTYRLVRRAGATAYATSVQRVPYEGMIGSAETGIGPVYVRRGNRPIWAGLWHLVLQQRFEMSGTAGVMRLPGAGLAAASPG
jgi:hypothetical protein